jgi:hypothetical protein
MSKHILSLEIYDTLNQCILTIDNNSIYSTTLPVECSYLDILPPGFRAAIRFEIDSNIKKYIYTACDLGLQTVNCTNKQENLPDGIYVIKHSVAPNEYVYIEYNHLRITNALNLLNKYYCKIDLGACDPTPKNKELLKEIQLIEMLLKAAKAKVEFCHEATKGLDLYEYAMKRLNKINCTDC